MNTDRVDFTWAGDEGVTWTLLATLYLRAYEYRHQTNPILGDRYAAEAVDRIDYDFDKILPKLHPDGGQYLVALRARKLDDWGRDFLARHPDATVLHLGCGLDSRMLRLDPEGLLNWFDVDMPEVIEMRRQLYPERGHYRLIASSVTDEGWLDAVPADKPVLVVAEGLLPYLTDHEVRTLLRRLTDRFSSGEVLFDGLAPYVLWSNRFLKESQRIFKSTQGDGRPVERENPRLTLAEAVPYGNQYRLVPSRGYRLVWRLFNAVPGIRDYGRNFRFTFG